eukprot:GFYU01001679.1.p1 GENE.GFYU01001679.1~~GFYU01001679.1.p1  ORF type:complete len:336 (-),score=116.80 GFYU01001679.1:29-1036(-)
MRMTEENLVWVDTDGGLEDLAALCVLLKQHSSNKMKICGISTVDGLCGPIEAAQYIRRLMYTVDEKLVHSIPIIVGARVALDGNKSRAISEESWGKNYREMIEEQISDLRLKEVPASVDSSSLKDTNGDMNELVREVAASWMLHAAKSITVLCCGPLTNIGAVLRDAGATVTERVKEFVVLGGAVKVFGNATNGLAETHFYVDPEAAEKVIRSGIPCSLVGLEVANEEAFSAHWHDISSLVSKSVEGRVLKDLLTISAHACDTECVAAAYLLERERVFETSVSHVRVETNEKQAGMTLEAPESSTDTSKVTLVSSVNKDGFFKFVSDTITVGTNA